MNPLSGPLNRKGFVLWTAISYTPVLILALIINNSEEVGAYKTEASLAIAFVYILMTVTFVRRLQDWGMNLFIALPVVIVYMLLPIPEPEIYYFVPVWLILLLLPSKDRK